MFKLEFLCHKDFLCFQAFVKKSSKWACFMPILYLRMKIIKHKIVGDASNHKGLARISH